jgi:hypothetical protein
MQFHSLTFTTKPTEDKPSVTTREWFTNEREAVQRRGVLFESGNLLGLKREQMIHPVEVPTKKEDLLDWLNENCN